jgi:hypothetical protein
MNTVLLLGLRVLMGGALVVAFALIGGAVKPKRLAGLFAASPSIAIGSLLLTSMTKGASAAEPLTTGMMIGSAGMLAYCAATMFTLERMGPLVGALSPWLVWAVVAGSVYLAVFH